MPVRPFQPKVREAHITNSKHLYWQELKWAQMKLGPRYDDGPRTMRPHIKAKRVRCPECNAEPWVPCRSSKGRVLWECHEPRLALIAFIPDELPEG